jgi:hypothetical protein
MTDMVRAPGDQTAGDSLDPGNHSDAEGAIPVLQDWSWQMRRRASANRRDRRGSRPPPTVNTMMMQGDRPAPIEVGVQAHIGNLLRAMYDSALKEPVPDRFLDLLRQMDAPETGSSAVNNSLETFKSPEGSK